MLFTASLIAAVLAPLALAAPASPTATDTLDVYAAQATAKTESPTSHVKGRIFDRYVSIWFENTDYDMAAADRECASLLCTLIFANFIQPTSSTLPERARSWRTYSA